MARNVSGIRVARSKGACQAAGGVWRKGVRGVRRGSCAIPSPRSPRARARANLARGRGVGAIVRRGAKCPAGLRKKIVRTPTNPRVEMCVKR